MAVMRDEFLAKAPDQLARCVANSRLADARVADAAAKDTRDDALKALAFEAHSMKGASATLHAAALSKACHRLERVAKGVPLDALEPDSGAYGEPTAPRTFEQRTREMADRFAELEADVADLAAITDVDVAAASEALGSRLCVTLARLAGDAAALAASPAALEAAAARAGGVGRNPSHTRHRREPLASLARTVAADAKAVGARALRNAVRRMSTEAGGRGGARWAEDWKTARAGLRRLRPPGQAKSQADIGAEVLEAAAEGLAFVLQVHRSAQKLVALLARPPADEAFFPALFLLVPA